MIIIEPITIDPATVTSNITDPAILANMFNGQSRVASSNTDLITVSYVPGGLYNSLALLNVEAQEVQITITLPDGSVIYDRVVDMINYSGITSYYDWFFGTPLRYNEVALLDLPSYDNTTLTVRASNDGENAVIGECVVGPQRYLGQLLYETPYSTVNNTKKARDSETEIVSIVPGENAISPTFLLKIEPHLFQNIRKTLNNYNNTNLVFIGDTGDPESIVYGFITNHSGVRKGFNKATYTISIEELTGW